MFHSLLDKPPFKTGGTIFKKSDLSDKNINKTEAVCHLMEFYSIYALTIN